MYDIRVEKKANCYTLEINVYYADEGEDVEYFYKTEEEMIADFPNVVAMAKKLKEENNAKKAAKENK